METPIRILVVDDFEPFRRFVCSTLLKRPGLQVVGEDIGRTGGDPESRRAQPDLIVLEHWVTEAQWNRGRSTNTRPSSPIQNNLLESRIFDRGGAGSPRLGGAGLCRKDTCWKRASESCGCTVLQGGRICQQGVGSEALIHSGTVDTPGNGLKSVEVLPTPVARKPEIARSHQAIFYPDDASLVVGFGDFIEASLDAGKSVIAVLTDSHLASLSNRLRGLGVDIAAALEQGRYFALDVADILPIFMRNDLADPMRFLGVVGDLVVTAARAKSGKSVSGCDLR